MTDPVATGGVPIAELAATGALPSSPPANLAAGDTQMFASMMRGAPPAEVTTATGSSVLGDAASSFAAQFSNGGRSLQDVRHSMLQSVDFNDPIKTMFVMTDHAMEAHMMMSKLHISTGLASAATSLFGNLLKNQQ